jgi:hypothetical protein
MHVALRGQGVHDGTDSFARARTLILRTECRSELTTLGCEGYIADLRIIS